jgi:hypothetical protein
MRQSVFRLNVLHGKREAPVADDEPPKPVDLRDVNRKAPETFFPRENPDPQESASESSNRSEKAQDEFEIRRKQFFGK